MGFFTKKYKCPPGHPQDWTARDVKHWLKHLHLDAFKTAFAPVNGALFCSLTIDTLQSILSKPVPNELLSAINELRNVWKLPTLQVPSAHSGVHFAAVTEEAPVAPSASSNAPGPVVDADSSDIHSHDEKEQEVTPIQQAGASEAGKYDDKQDGERLVQAAEPTCAQDETHNLPAEKDAVVYEMTQLEFTDRVTRETEDSLVEPCPQQPAFLQEHLVTVADWAAILQPYTVCDMESVKGYLENLGSGIGSGLASATVCNPNYGNMFGAAMSLELAAARAGVARGNCSKAAGLASDVLRVLDNAWRRQLPVVVSKDSDKFLNDDHLTDMLAKFATLDFLAQPFSQTGWLLELTCNESLKDKFDGAHNAVVDILKRVSLEALPSGKTLLRGDYRDAARPIRKLLKVYGGGNVTQGLMALKTQGIQGEGIKELARTLDLDGGKDNYGPALIMSELDTLPTDAELDIEVYYNNLVLSKQAQNSQAFSAVFDHYVQDGGEAMDVVTFEQVLADLGLLDGKKDTDAATVVQASFKAADVKNEGIVTRDAFCAYYATLTTSRARQQLRANMGIAVEEELRRVFTAFATFGTKTTDLDNARFLKLIKDCGMTGKNLTSTDVDLIFTKSKTRGARKITFEQFLTALSMCADKKGMSLEECVRKVLTTGGPIVHATRPDAVRLHDDKSTYTGVYAKGGPKAVDPPKNDLSSILDRSEADVRGVKKTPQPKTGPTLKSHALAGRLTPSTPPPEFLRSSLGPNNPILHATLAASNAGSRRTTGASSGAPADLKEMFTAFASFGNATAGNAGKVEMDSSRFQKLLKECRILDTTGKAGLNAAKADLIFAKVRQQGQSKISYTDFDKALQLVAQAKNVDVEDVRTAVCISDGPLRTRLIQG